MLSLLTNALLAALLTGNLGGSGEWLQHLDPTRSVDRHPNVTDNVLVIEGDEWVRPWQIAQPVPVTPVRTHGHIGP
jgi:hypothetical protein